MSDSAAAIQSSDLAVNIAGIGMYGIAIACIFASIMARLPWYRLPCGLGRLSWAI